MHLIQIFLPARSDNKEPFAKENYVRIRQTLTEKFGGLTAYTRAPAEGLWKDEENTTHKDEIVIFELMADELNEAWWRNYKENLERTFSQDKIIIRVQNLRIL